MTTNHSMTSIIIHFVFVTKFRHELIWTDHILDMIRGIMERTGCQVLELNSAGNHIHAIIDMHPSITVSEFACKVKSESSGVLKKLYKNWEFWQRGYFACSVGSESINKVKEYIRNQ